VSSGVDPYAYMQQVAGVLDRLDDRAQINTILDELEYLYEVLDPELQPLADGLMDRLRRRLEQVP
jgi:ribosome assembly protein YihI (activator of Der GTPase)